MRLEQQLKQLIIEELKLEDVTPEDLADDDPLFGEGLGLDSLDAVELVVILNKHFDVDLKEMEKARPAFQSISTLAEYIRQEKGETVDG